MSRTFRRKGYEHETGRSWYGSGGKIAGYYTEYDYVWCEDEEYRWRESVYRAPTEAEYNTRFWRVHGESSHHNAWTPGPEFRKNRMRENRMINKEELNKWIRNPDNYEPLFEADPRNCWWDWD